MISLLLILNIFASDVDPVITTGLKNISKKETVVEILPEEKFEKSSEVVPQKTLVKIEDVQVKAPKQIKKEDLLPRVLPEKIAQTTIETIPQATPRPVEPKPVRQEPSFFEPVLATPTPAPKVEPKKVITIKQKISEEEQALLDKYDRDQKAMKEREALSKLQEEKKLKAIYVPAPVEPKKPENGLLIERDSSKIRKVFMNTNDAINVTMCYSSGVNVILDENIRDTFQSVRLDDKIFFDAQIHENNRGVYIKLKNPIEEGSFWESSIRLIRKSDDKVYLINLMGIACPEDGLITYPKVIYLMDRIGLIDRNSKVLPPEDTIIQMSKGLPRIQKNSVRIYDVVASSSSDWMILGLEVQYTDRSVKTASPKISLLDNFQVSEIKSRTQYLPVQSKKASDLRGIPTLRFSVKANINKNYVLKNRYLHLMYLDEEEGYYQYLQIDMLPHFLKLINRGFEL